MTKKIPQLQQYETLIYIEKSRQKTLEQTNQKKFKNSKHLTEKLQGDDMLKDQNQNDNDRFIPVGKQLKICR